MPTERFCNLPAAKQQRIMQAAKAELSRVPYPEMSINKVVQAAGIPRGSFYQYFRDKDDLLNHMICGYGQVVMDSIVAALRSGGRYDLFDLIDMALHSTVEFGMREENRTVYSNVLAHMPLDYGQTLEMMRLDLPGALRQYGRYLDFSALKRQDEGFILELADVLLVFMRQAIMQVFKDVEHKDAAIENYKRKTQMLKFGVVKQPEVTA